jgi:hypothetical protein
MKLPSLIEPVSVPLLRNSVADEGDPLRVGRRLEGEGYVQNAVLTLQVWRSGDD